MKEDLCNVYSVHRISKELWNTLEKKYKTEDTKKFMAAKFLEFKMVDNKSVISQVQELQVIIHDFLAKFMIVKESFQVTNFIEKSPPLWKECINYLKYM